MGLEPIRRKARPLPTPTWDFAKVDESGNVSKPVLKYHTGGEDDVKHDLLALRRGEIYERDEFYKRAKAWYKAEIDREILQDAQQKAWNQEKGPRVVYCYGLRGLDAFGGEIRGGTAPTRVQPSRAAKRKAAPPPSPRVTKKRATHRKKKEDDWELFPFTGGDYSLDPYDRERALVRRDGLSEDDGPTPPDNDVAIFVLRLSRVIATQIAMIHTSGYIRRRKAGKLRCALDSAAKRKKYKLPKDGDFQPAAAVLPEEDLIEEDKAGSRLPDFPNAGKTYLVKEFLDEVETKSEKGKGLTGTPPAPEPEMVTSPTLGRWPSSKEKKNQEAPTWDPTNHQRWPPFSEDDLKWREKREKELNANPKRAILEKLERDCTVVVAGLEFAIDLCKSEMGSEDGARFVML
ncbi:hypothetical protein QBC41DRAFT_383887 [Cercophora samala]|uniref:Uncharacterized protein n=1 Tax=Cercophora samala TaxID=330535 RepID=A0AA39ZIZ7_9PEZI|nr:hypothetical protein QBC41DRAFT_383887 [Cercophora samala]